MNTIVKATNLIKKYGEKIAVDGISFEIKEGEIFGLIGPNGAGKTTTLRILATLLKPTSGEVMIDGLDVVKDAGKVRERISYLPEESGAYPNMTGIEYLKFVADLYGLDHSVVEEGSTISGLGEALNEKIKTYSKGMKRRLLLARTLMVKPKLAIIDEPTSGVDVIHSFHLRRTIKEFSKKNSITIVLSSHNMLEVEHLCDRVALIYNGKIVVQDEPKKLIAEFKAENLEEAFFKAIGEVR